MVVDCAGSPVLQYSFADDSSLEFDYSFPRRVGNVHALDLGAVEAWTGLEAVE